MIRVVDADCTADLVNTQGRGFEQVAGDTDSPPVQVLERCDTIVSPNSRQMRYLLVLNLASKSSRE